MKTERPYYTKRALEKVIIFRAGIRDVELLRAAAGHDEVSQSGFLRQALREKAARVLSGAERREAPGR